MSAATVPAGCCDCGNDLVDAADLGVVDSYQSHEIPQVAVRVTQYDQHGWRAADAVGPTSRLDSTGLG